ncbi:MAG: hypothetical protein J1E38_08960 [Paramuribaculum sp.]|nr:hypothetical protein [Paramuribaculum sp.]
MKKILIILDGAADLPCDELRGKTPFEAAHTPNIGMLARSGRKSMFRTFDDGRIPGSENAILKLLGYPPEIYGKVGRGPFEALGVGIDISDEDHAIRCNIVEINAEGSFITDRPADIKIDALKNRFLGHFSALKSLGYRVTHFSDLKSVAVSKNRFYGHIYHPPHESKFKGVKNWQILPPDQPDSDEAKALSTIINDRIRIDIGGSARYFSLWLWGGGRLPQLTPFSKLSGYEKPAAITGTPLVRGIALATGITAPHIPGATGSLHTDYDGKAMAAAAALEGGSEFVLIHVEAPDEAGHLGDPLLKMHALEEIDRHLVGTLLSLLSSKKITAEITITADHPTPCALRRHTSEPVEMLSAVI